MVKDSMLSLLGLRSLLWHRFSPWPRELSSVAGTTKDKIPLGGFHRVTVQALLPRSGKRRSCHYDLSDSPEF